jgi:serine/threonine-protein kinase HipA
VKVQPGRIVRQHQEDLCQALATSAKYEEHGGPSALKIVQFLRDASGSPRVARANVAAFVDGLIYNTVIAAPDAHARNYSVFLKGDEVEFAPLYDVATGLAYEVEDGNGRTLAMSISGEFDANLIGKGHWKEFALRARLDPDDVTERVMQIVNGADAAFNRALAESATHDWDGQVADVTNRFRPALMQHIASLRHRMK